MKTFCIVLLGLGLVLGLNAQNKVANQIGSKRIDPLKINALIEQELACESVRRGLAERDDIRDRLRNARRHILLQALKEDFLRKIANPTEPELNAEYQRFASNWIVPEAYLLDAVEMGKLDKKLQEKALKLVNAQIVKDADLKDLFAKAIVLQKSGQWLVKKNLAPEIWRDLSKMKNGELRIIKTKTGDFLIRKGNYRAASRLPLEKVRAQLIQAVRKRKLEKVWNDYLLNIQARLLKN